jgi:hypothetical protein
VKIGGYPGAKANIKLISPAGKILTQKSRDFPPGMDENEVVFDFSPDTIGIQVYSIQIEPLSEDDASSNNNRHFAVKVLQSKLKPLLIAGSPNSDVAFLKRTLERNPNIELTLKVQVKGSEFKTIGKELAPDNCDALILVDYPTVESSSPYVQQMIGAVDNEIPLILIPLDNFRPEALRSISHLLPASFGRKGEEISVKLAPASGTSPLLDFFPTTLDWNNLAPVKKFTGFVKVRNGVQTLVNTQNDEPAIVFLNTSGKKVLLFAVHDLWRLSLQDLEHSQGDSLMSDFWQSSLRWLASREEQELFQISTGKKIFTCGENVVFDATLYDASFRPKSGAKVTMTTHSAEGEREWEFTPTEQGRYKCSAQFFQDGECRYQASAVIGKDTLRTEGELVVETFNPEYVDSRSRPEILRTISSSTGGFFYLPSQFEQFFSDYRPSPENYLNKKDLRLFPRWISLIVIIALLTVEWVIRKSKGML